MVPQWDPEKKVYTLPFYNRASLTSVHNFMLARPEAPDDTQLLCGKRAHEGASVETPGNRKTGQSIGASMPRRAARQCLRWRNNASADAIPLALFFSQIAIRLQSEVGMLCGHWCQ